MVKLNVIFLAYVFFYFVTFSVNAHDGTVKISGIIQDNTCELAPDSQYKEVNMGALARKQFTHAGESTPFKTFVIHLNNCGPAAEEATVMFSGTLSQSNQSFFSIDGNSDAATGIALGIYNNNGKQIQPNEKSDGIALTPGQSTVNLAFMARYVAMQSNVTSGNADVSITFSVIYD